MAPFEDQNDPNPILVKILTTLGGLEARMTDIAGHVEDSHVALRGRDADPGLVAMVRILRDKVDGMSVSSIKDHDTLLDLERRLKALEEYQEFYPSVAWMMGHKAKTVLVWGAAGLALLLIVLSPALDKRFVTTIMTWLHIPDAVIDFYTGVPVGQ